MDEDNTDQDDIPGTQQSRTQMEQNFESYEKKKPETTETDPDTFIKIFKEVMEKNFEGWTQSRLAKFPTKSALIPSGGKAIHPTALSRIQTGKTAPGKQMRERLLRWYRKILPRLTVDDEISQSEFEILPGAINMVRKLTEVPQEDEVEPNVLRRYGDSEMRLNDFRRLVILPGSENVSGSRSWLSDSVINIMTSLYAKLSEDRRIAFMNTLTVSQIMDLHYQLNHCSGLSDKEREEKRNRIMNSQSKIRSGQMFTSVDAQYIFAPCLANGNHRIAFLMTKSDHSIICLDSMRNEDRGQYYSNPSPNYSQKWKALPGFTRERILLSLSRTMTEIAEFIPS